MQESFNNELIYDKLLDQHMNANRTFFGDRNLTLSAMSPQPNTKCRSNLVSGSGRKEDYGLNNQNRQIFS